MGGTFTAYNKIRPGAYINFETIPPAPFAVGARGTATMPVTANWGEENKIIELTPVDMINGNFEKWFGDTDRLIFELMLSGCSKALIYRVNGGTKATADLGDLDITAKYSGTFGNKISVAVLTGGEVVTYANGDIVDRQTVTDYEDLSDNDYVSFIGAGVPTETAATALTAGTNGTAVYTGYFTAMKTAKWQTMAIPTDDTAVSANAVALIKAMREDEGVKVQAVLALDNANYEGIIKVKQALKLDSTVVTSHQLTAYIAGITAGTAIPNGNTARETPFTGIVSELTNSEIERDLLKGFFLFSSMSNGGVKVEQDINSLTDYTPTKGELFSFNLIVRLIDEIANTVTSVFEKSYMGKLLNDDIGRSSFKSDLISYANSLVALRAIQNFTPNDITIAAGAKSNEVVVTMGIQPVNTIEKLYMTVKLR